MRRALACGLLCLVAVPLSAQELFIDDAVVIEGAGGIVQAVFTVRLENDTGGPVSVFWATQDGSATEFDNDYEVNKGTVVFNGGIPADGPTQTQDVIVNVFGDTQIENDENFFVQLSGADGATVVDGVGEGTILNDDFPELSIDDVALFEGDTGTTDATFTVTLSEAAPFQVQVNFGTRDGTATASGNDYLPMTGVVVFPPTPFTGPQTQSIVIPVVGDPVVEPDENFFVDLANASNAILVDPQGEAMIQNDDATELSIGDATVNEGNSGTRDALFTLSLSNPSDLPVRVDAATRDGSATVGDDDYIAVAQQVVFGPRQLTANLVVPVRGDTAVEPDEDFFVDLTNANGATIADPEGQGTIVNDDEEVPPPPPPEPDSEVELLEISNVLESSGIATIAVRRTGGGGAVSVTLNVTGGSATPGDDFVAGTATLNWGAEETGTKTAGVEILDDNAVEGAETVQVAMTASGADVVGPANREFTINDDDDPMTVELLGDPESSSLVNGEVELSVRVLSGEGSPIAGAGVRWSVEGDAAPVNGPGSTSDSDGVARKRIQVGPTPGRVIVTARLVGRNQSSVFEILVSGDLESLFDGASSPGPASVASVLDESCAAAQGSFADACDYIFGLTSPSDRRRVVTELTPREVAAQSTLSFDTMRIQLRNIGNRLSALRGGGTRTSVEQLAFRGSSGGFTFGQLSRRALAPGDSVVRWLEGGPWRRSIAVQGEEGAAGGGALVLDESPSPWGVFANGTLTVGDRPGTVSEEGFEFDTNGLTFGVDYLMSDRLVLGAAGGWFGTDLELDRRGGGLDANGTSLSGYVLVFSEQAYFTGIVTFGEADYDLTRNIDLPSPFQGDSRLGALASTGSDQFSIGLEAGYDRSKEERTIGTFLRLSKVDADVDGYDERGAGPFVLTIFGQDVESLLAEAGLNVSWALSRDWGVLQPLLRVSYLHEFEDGTRLIRGRFRNDVLANEFAIPTDTPDRNYFNAAAGLTFTLPKGRSFFILVDADLAREDLDAASLSFGLRWEL